MANRTSLSDIGNSAPNSDSWGRRQTAFMLPLLLGAALSACTTVAQRELEVMSARADLVRVAERECWSSVESASGKRMLEERLLFDVDDPERLTKQTLKGPATTIEKRALIEYSRLGVRCRKLQIEGWSMVHPLIATALAQSYSKLDEAELRLLRDEIAVGEFNQTVLAIRVSRQRAWESAFDQVNMQLQSAHSAEVSQRQAALSEALRIWTTQQQALARQHSTIESGQAGFRTPTYTRCFLTQGIVRCTTE